ncbi:isoflavone 2'-hydroxylase-like [Phalaenopsis equestris]|uniref:isoflavone 2'-hydroxylase-like n=1 Tax=Phalaenopsis equestris TaxID=78828 RepID=UPI0009E51CFB|nr:isoflavone 2'-hydroxylase-like [Phalaenopsis equestris]
MEVTYLFYFVTLLTITLPFILFGRRRSHLKLPRTIPDVLPIIGHLHLIVRWPSQPLHRTLAELSSTYGPILHLRFGSRPVLIISSPSAVEECLTTNDKIFANRPSLLSTKYLAFNNSMIAAAPYGPHWRNLRRIATTELLSTSRIVSLALIRADETQSLLHSLFSAAAIADNKWSRAEMKSRLKRLNFNSIMRMVDGEENNEDSFWRMIEEAFRLTSFSSVEDFLPWTSWFSLGGIKRRMMRLEKEMDERFQRMVDERRRRRVVVKEEVEKKTLIDVMLDLQQEEPERYSDLIIKGMLWALIAAGTDTTSVTVEWALSLLLNHPKALKKARDEIDFHVGHDRLITDLDLPHLPYLQNIIKETLRLYPAGPLLLPHHSSANCTVEGYHIASGTMLLINVYAIQRDPKLWKEAESFRPERFDEGEGAEGFKFFPFGSGRRRCPGEGMANRVLGLTLGALVQCFEWERVGEEMIDLSEGEGATLSKLVPLEVKYKPREAMANVLSQL